MDGGGGESQSDLKAIPLPVLRAQVVVVCSHGDSERGWTSRASCTTVTLGDSLVWCDLGFGLGAPAALVLCLELVELLLLLLELLLCQAVLFLQKVICRPDNLPCLAVNSNEHELDAVKKVLQGCMTDPLSLLSFHLLQ